MNNNYSSYDEYGNIEYLERWLTPTLREAINEHQILVLTGARQVGKSTLLRNATPFSEWRFHTMDDFDVLQQAQSGPEALWAGTDRIVLDEVQKAPHLLPAIKQAVDENPGRYRFVLSGSANLLLMSPVSESLAGRAVYFILAPLTIGERHKRLQPSILADLLTGHWPDEDSDAAPSLDPVPILLQGLMPALLPLPSSQSWIRWWDGYITTYLERDLR
ncbi:MAG: AAA family ATPase [Chloroflexota bacterium]